MAQDDTSKLHVLPAFVPFFWSFVGIGIVLFIYSIKYAKKYCTTAAFLLTPFICISLIFDNVIMATTGIDRRCTSTQAMLAFHACITPMLLLVYYELAYLVHKHKSVNFCGISFESDHRECRSIGTNTRARGTLGRRRWLLSTCLRFMVWLLSFGLLILNLLIAYHWTNTMMPEVTSFYHLQGDNVAHTICAILPALVLVILSLYVGMKLWNYGSHYSYMVHATCLNPWIWMLLGALALLIGYIMPSPLYAVSSNAGELVMMGTIVRMFREVHHDMQQALEFHEFIDPERAARSQQVQTFGPPNLCLSKSISHNKMAHEHTSGYITVSTPKAAEPSTSFANRLHTDHSISSSTNTAFLSVVVAQESIDSLHS